MTTWTLNTNLFHDCLGMVAIWEITTSVELTKSTKFNNHWTATHFTIKSSWFILDLDFFHFFFSLGNLFRERFVKGINDTLPLLFSDFDIIQLAFHFSCEGHIYDIWEIFNDELVNNFSQLCWFKTFGCKANIITFLNGFNGWCVG